MGLCRVLLHSTREKDLNILRNILFLLIPLLFLILIVSVPQSLTADVFQSFPNSAPGLTLPANRSSQLILLGRGMAGRIGCPLRASPPDVVIVWTKNDRPLDLTTSTSRSRMDRRGGLVFKLVEDQDEGLYRCTTYSPMAPTHRSQLMNVLVKDPPFFIIRPSAVYQATPGQTITMPCVAHGDPPPRMVWNKVSGEFPPLQRRDQEEGNMTLALLKMNDSGTYECIAVNVVATVVTTTTLIIESIASSHGPYNLSAQTSTNCIRLSWLPSYHNGCQQHYVLWHRPEREARAAAAAEGGWQTLKVLPENTTWMSLYGLETNTRYEFMVMSRDDCGLEFFSSILTAATTRPALIVKVLPSTTIFSSHSSGRVKTPSPSRSHSLQSILPSTPIPTNRVIAIRPSPPSDLSVAVTSQGLEITWSSPQRSPVPAQYYVVEYRTVGQWVPLTGKTIKTSYVWTTVSRGATYHFRVISYAGDRLTSSEPSTTLTFHTEDPITQGTVRFGNGAVGGLLAGLLFVITSVALSILIVRILRKRRRQKDNRYRNCCRCSQNVKYFGPNHHSAAVDKNETHDDMCEATQVLTNCVSTNIAQHEFCDKFRESRDEHSMITEIVQAEATV